MLTRIVVAALCGSVLLSAPVFASNGRTFNPPGEGTPAETTGAGTR